MLRPVDSFSRTSHRIASTCLHLLSLSPLIFPCVFVVVVSVLQCGCPCGGVRNESSCLPCLSHQLGVAAQLCAICGTDPLSSAACIQLNAPCLHVFHLDCVRRQLAMAWPTPRISFRFLQCPLCQQPLCHPRLSAQLAPLHELRSRVEQLALTRLYHDGREADRDVAAVDGRFHNDPMAHALHIYAFYQCYEVDNSTHAQQHEAAGAI